MNYSTTFTLTMLLASLALPALAADPEKRVLVRVAAAGAAGQIEIIQARNGALSERLNMQCDRIHQGQEVLACLRTVPGQGVKLDLADRQGKLQATLNFPNVLLASRVRVSPGGDMVALTGFSAGHTYTGTDFATRTYIVDSVRKRLIADVSTFKVVENAGLKLSARRINVWGVSFYPKSAQRFVATVGAGGQVFLAEGDMQAKTLTLLRGEMECPSLSPDAKKIAFKRRDGAGSWLPAVYDLATGKETVMKQDGGVDDQIEWLDDATIAYEVAKSGGVSDVFVRPADGSGKARLLRANSGSPTALK